MVHKKTDPRYALVRGHIPKGLLKRFKSYCVEHELDFSEGLESILGRFFHMIDLGQIEPIESMHNNLIAELIADWDLEELADLSEVTVENLQAIAQGKRPTNDDLIGLGTVLCKEDGQPWTTEELISIRDRESYHNSLSMRYRHKSPI